MHHELKIQPAYLQAILAGEKTCEIRFNDRDYQKGDTITFIGTQGEGISGVYLITHILSYEGLKDGWVALSIKQNF